MASYPAFDIEDRSNEVLVDDIKIDRASNGSVKSRVLSLTKRTFSISHVVDSEDLESLLDFYQANKTQEFDFTWPRSGLTYSCIFVQPPKLATIHAELYRVTMEIAEV